MDEIELVASTFRLRESSGGTAVALAQAVKWELVTALASMEESASLIGYDSRCRAAQSHRRCCASAIT
jgi:hypothetical protein